MITFMYLDFKSLQTKIATKKYPKINLPDRAAFLRQKCFIKMQSTENLD